MAATALNNINSCFLCTPKALSDHDRIERRRRVQARRDIPEAPPGLQRKVSFGSVKVREFNRIAGDHPDCPTGPPMSIDWKYVELEPVTVNHYEGRRRRSGLFALSSGIRKEILQYGFHVSEEEIQAAEKAATKAARKRDQTRRHQHFTRRTRQILQVATSPFLRGRRHKRSRNF